ncbi:hypothetical protein GLOTRDRAFT_134590 [Gloeophyllum trabeum ATCC 11539]|uniref:JmjC domain-containing protein n=1 Tax=Gloeophyllum trabeum (strain ATCC 11539 / FP-39264 / Madison 617) TaxID=670483 RepID=S7R5Z9_GLOTA|nr:uncharacterized protein GLOTRDRAFT_134590 [Gloeophyllum trabeum ATCC 11539]EPQ49805.1 hypothetical protein GLOTRDRAFT_134590 [Gloeophyllum trabeum ATCC 11539]
MAAAPDALNPDESGEALVFSFDINSMCCDSMYPTPDESSKVVARVKEKLAIGVPVLIRGFKLPGPQYKFDRPSMEQYKSSLHNPVVFQDAAKRSKYVRSLKDAGYNSSDDEAAESSGDEGTPPKIYGELPLGEFIDKATSTRICGNLLDSYAPDHSGMPWFIGLMNEQNHAMFQNRLYNLALPCKAGTKRRKLEDAAELAGPQLMHPDTYQLVMWDLITHGGFVSHTHHDAGGAATWMAIRDGAKFWTLIKMKTDGLVSREQVQQRFKRATKSLPKLLEKYHDEVEQIGTVCLVPGDILIQPPNIMHCVYTPVKTVATGGHFYCYDLCHLTELSLDIDRKYGHVTTNQAHPSVLRLIGNLALALPNRWDKPLRKIPFLALALMVLDSNKYEGNSKGQGSAQYYPQGRYMREIKGESAYAKQVINCVLDFNGIPGDVPSMHSLIHKRPGKDINSPGDEYVDLSCLKSFEFVSVVQ